MHVESFQTNDEIDVTPLLDVVFILLIFFIVTSSFVREAGIDIHFPDKNPQTTKSSQPIIVSVGPGGEVQINGRIAGLKSVNPSIRVLRSQDASRTVVMKVSSGAKLGVLVAVLDGIRLAGVDLPPIELFD